MSHPNLGPYTEGFPHYNQCETKTKVKTTNTNEKLNKKTIID